MPQYAILTRTSSLPHALLHGQLKLYRYYYSAGLHVLRRYILDPDIILCMETECSDVCHCNPRVLNVSEIVV
jgi:hypothetical protein